MQTISNKTIKQYEIYFLFIIFSQFVFLFSYSK